MATPQMFRALGIRLTRGRLLSEGDVAGRPLVAVINETAVQLYWSGDDPIGRTIRYNPQQPIRIVGIVGDVRSIGASEAAPPAIYVPLAQAPRPPYYEGRSMTFVIRTAGNATDIAASARAAVASIDPGLPLADLRSMSEIVSTAAGQPRFNTFVMSFFAGIAFFLAALGLYGILAYHVEQRVREIGVRIALGAGKREIFRLIIGRYRRRSLRVGVDAADGWNAVRFTEHRSSDLHRCRWDTSDLSPAGELLAGSARHSCGPDRGAARGVAVFFAEVVPAVSASTRKGFGRSRRITNDQSCGGASFTPQGNHWIDSRCAARGGQTRESCDAQKNQRCYGDCRDEVRPEAIEQSVQETRGGY